MPEKRPLKVCHVVLSMDVGGMERNVVNQCRLGPSVGQEVSILCVERRGTLAPKAESLGARFLCADKKPGLRLGTVLSIRKALKELRPDVVHTHQIGPLFYTGLACKGLGIPLVVHTEHGKVNYTGRKRTWWLGRIAGSFTKRFYCLSQDMADAVAKSGVVPEEKVRVILNGIDTAFYKEPRDSAAVRRSLGVPDDAPLIGTVGRLNEIKRQDVLLEAFAKVRERHPSAHLVLVGDGPLMADLTARARRLGLEGSVHFAGYQSDTTPFQHAMDVFALTSRSEGTPQSILEACVVGVPVIASRVGGIPEIIEDRVTGMLVEVGNVDQLAAGLCRLIEDREYARTLSRAASDRVIRRYDVARMAGDYHRDFVELLGRDGGGTKQNDQLPGQANPALPGRN